MEEERDYLILRSESWTNIHYNQYGELEEKMSHAHHSEAVIYADQEANYLHTIHYKYDGVGQVEVVDLTDAIREYHAEVALERRHEASLMGEL